jgi:hypothetical protein
MQVRYGNCPSTWLDPTELSDAAARTSSPETTPDDLHRLNLPSPDTEPQWGRHRPGGDIVGTMGAKAILGRQRGSEGANGPGRAHPLDANPELAEHHSVLIGVPERAP